MRRHSRELTRDLAGFFATGAGGDIRVSRDVPIPSKRKPEQIKVALSDWFVYAEFTWFVIWTLVRTEYHVHDRREVSVVTGTSIAIMVPMVQLWSTDKHSERPNRQSYI